jgi:superfamily II DNA or RNA helicase
MASRTSTDYSYDDRESEPIGATVKGRPDAALKDSVSRTLKNGTLEIRLARVKNDPDDVCSQIEEALGRGSLADEKRSDEDIILAHEQAESAALGARKRTSRHMSPAEVERLVDQCRPTLVYGFNRAHAEHLQQRFIEAGIAAAYVDCFTDRLERERIFARFRVGDVKAICNVATLSTGLDLPMVSCLIDARPTKSEIRFVQTVGRGLRTAPGKDRLIILDHSGNALRLGLVTDIHHERLDSGEPRKTGASSKDREMPLPRLCQDCSAVMPRSVKVCPECGKVREVRTDVEHQDGELIELGVRPTKRNTTRIIAEQQDFYGELRWIASVRGYAPGWASHKFKERFDVWPNDRQVRLATPREPSLKTKNWIRSRQIAYVKAREAAHA